MSILGANATVQPYNTLPPSTERHDPRTLGKPSHTAAKDDSDIDRDARETVAEDQSRTQNRIEGFYLQDLLEMLESVIAEEKRALREAGKCQERKWTKSLLEPAKKPSYRRILLETQCEMEDRDAMTDARMLRWEKSLGENPPLFTEKRDTSFQRPDQVIDAIDHEDAAIWSSNSVW